MLEKREDGESEQLNAKGQREETDDQNVQLKMLIRNECRDP